MSSGSCRRARGPSTALLLLALTAVSAGAQAKEQKAKRPQAATAETARWVAAQVALDRASFSPGEIDGRPGTNTTRALEGFQQRHALAVTGQLDESTVAALGEWFTTPTTTYTITNADLAGPFAPAIPDDMMELAGLDALNYRSALEMLAERFHVQPALLQRMNHGVALVAGQTIEVPNVEPFHPPLERKAPKPQFEAAGSMITVSETTKTIRVTSSDGTVAFQAPVSIGSEQDPLPKGEWTVTGAAVLPVFHYNPALFWDADPSHAKAKIAPGPNNPVGVVWIDLSRPHMGFHGTPEPSTIGKTQSHGCLRLTNWDAMRLAARVGRGTRVVLQ
jgi:lipoprotein-anchoring transpeptidase ErfK/SrfK